METGDGSTSGVDGVALALGGMVMMAAGGPRSPRGPGVRVRDLSEYV